MRFLRLDEGWLSFLLLAGVVLSPVAAVAAGNWVDGLHILLWLAAAGLLVGLLFARIGVPYVIAHLLSLVIAGIGIIYAASTTLPARVDGGIRERWVAVFDHLVAWSEVVRRGWMNTDPLLFLMFLGALTWLVGYFSSWSMYRQHSAWWAIAASGAALVINASYGPDLAAYTIPFLLFSLLLVGQLNLYRSEQTWRQQGIAFDPQVRGGTLRLGLALGVMIVLASWVAPEITAQEGVAQVVAQAGRPWGQLVEGVGRLFGGGTRGRIPVQTSGFSDELVLSGNVRLGDNIVLRVWADREAYLKAVTFDRYTGTGWQASDPARMEYVRPGEAPLAVEYELRQELDQTIEVIVPKDAVVFGASEPMWTSIAVEARLLPPLPAARTKSRGTAPSAQGYPWQEDIVGLEAPLGVGDRYTVLSSISRADAQALRGAGTNYPRQVTTRYLPLPPIPSRVATLAAQIVAPHANNPYDKARAIEDYLRQLRYDVNIDPPPAGADGVEYFLFETQRGYCDYFASSMVVMLRSVGVPARVVSGYAPGVRESSGGPLTIRDNNAHSWVEVYFPRYGWVQFEPSPYLPRIPRGTDDPEAAPTATPTPTTVEVPDDQNMPPEPEGGLGSSGWFGGGPDLPLLGWVALVLSAAAISLLALNVLWQAGFAGLPTAIAVYGRLTQLASVLGWRPKSTETPHEYVRRLSERVPAQWDRLRMIADSFVAQRFGRRQTTPNDETILRMAWQQARQGLIGAALRSLWQR